MQALHDAARMIMTGDAQVCHSWRRGAYGARADEPRLDFAGLSRESVAKAAGMMG